MSKDDLLQSQNTNSVTNYVTSVILLHPRDALRNNVECPGITIRSIKRQEIWQLTLSQSSSKLKYSGDKTITRILICPSLAGVGILASSSNCSVKNAHCVENQNLLQLIIVIVNRTSSIPSQWHKGQFDNRDIFGILTEFTTKTEFSRHLINIRGPVLGSWREVCNSKR